MRGAVTLTSACIAALLRPAGFSPGRSLGGRKVEFNFLLSSRERLLEDVARLQRRPAVDGGDSQRRPRRRRRLLAVSQSEATLQRHFFAAGGPVSPREPIPSFLATLAKPSAHPCGRGGRAQATGKCTGFYLPSKRLATTSAATLNGRILNTLLRSNGPPPSTWAPTGAGSGFLRKPHVRLMRALPGERLRHAAAAACATSASLP